MEGVESGNPQEFFGVAKKPPEPPKASKPLKETEKAAFSEPDRKEHKYVGLERLDEIAKDEPLMKGAAELGNERAQARFDAIRRERQAIFERYGIDKELCEKYGINFELLTDAKTVSRLLIKRTVTGLPTTKEGFIRMFRGEGTHPDETGDWNIGKWFAHDLDIASSYPIGPLGDSRVVYVDIPETSLKGYHTNDMPEFRGASKVGEYLLPQDVVSQAKEFIRFLKTDTTGDPWATN